MDTVRVLMVDDNPDDLELFGRALRQSDEWQPELVTATTGGAGLAQLHSAGPFDVLLLDHKLPDRSGLDYLEEWAESVPDLPAVVMLTGHGGERIAVDAMKHGAFDYFSKHNCDDEELRQTIRRAAHVTRLRRALDSERGRRAQIEAQLRDALADPGEMSGVRRTVATFLHEINSPLTGIVGYINMLRDGAPAQDSAAIHDEMLDACRRIAQVLHSMEALEAARPRPGGKPNGPLDLRALM